MLNNQTQAKLNATLIVLVLWSAITATALIVDNSWVIFSVVMVSLSAIAMTIQIWRKK